IDGRVDAVVIDGRAAGVDVRAGQAGHEGAGEGRARLHLQGPAVEVDDAGRGPLVDVAARLHAAGGDGPAVRPAADVQDAGDRAAAGLRGGDVAEQHAVGVERAAVADVH